MLEQAFRDFSNQVITMGDRGFLKVGEYQDPCIFLAQGQAKVFKFILNHDNLMAVFNY